MKSSVRGVHVVTAIAGGARIRLLRRFTPADALTAMLDDAQEPTPDDRDAILQRKLTQIFRSTPYRHAMLQGRETEGRRDDLTAHASHLDRLDHRPHPDLAGGTAGDQDGQLARGSARSQPGFNITAG